MYVLYSFVISLLFIALLPYFLVQALRHGKYTGSFRQRIGRLPEAVRGDGTGTVWLHAVSVGELLSARVLIDRLGTELPGFRIVVSTTTHTGQALARSQSEKLAGTFYFPFDWSFAVRRALAWVRPSVVIILETELWPNFLRECRRRDVPTLLANGRISQRSFGRYRRAPAFIRRVIEDLSLLLMQSEEDARRARTLGAPPDRVRVCGNLKYDQATVGYPEPTVRLDCNATNHNSDDGSASVSPENAIDRQFGLSSSPHLVVAGSTAPGEEEILLASFGLVRERPGLEDARLLIAPRHPERFDEVARLIARSGFTYARRSDMSSEVCAPDVILLDTIGELASLYRFAAVVFVGGSLVPRGGHNIIEPAAFGKPIVVGRHMHNFRQIISDFQRAGAIVQIGAAAEEAHDALSRELIRLLTDRERALEIGLRARNILAANRGATDCTVSALRQLMKLDG